MSGLLEEFDIPEEERETVIKMVDTNKDGKISFKEFVVAALEM